MRRARSGERQFPGEGVGSWSCLYHAVPGTPKAVVAACMHKLAHLIYGILKSGTEFNANFMVARLDYGI